MRAIVVVLLFVSGCERDLDIWRQPQVGDRQLATILHTSDLIGPDGRAHHGQSVTRMVILGFHDVDSLDVTVEDSSRSSLALRFLAHDSDGADLPAIITRGTRRVTPTENHTVLNAEIGFDQRVVGHAHAEIHVATYFRNSEGS